MLKTFAIHLIGGVLAALGKYFAFSLFENDVIVGFLIASVVMIFYYVLAGAILKNVAFGKTILFMQVTAFLFRDITALGDSFKDIFLILNGGSGIWLSTSYFIAKGGKWYPFIAYITLFLVFPVFIYIGQGLARKEFPKIKDKFMFAKVALLHLFTGLIFSGCRILYFYVLTSPYAEIALYISVVIVVALFIAGGILLKEVSCINTFLIMLNITIAGNSLLVSPVASKFAYPFIGGGGILYEFSYCIFPEGALSGFKQAVYLIPPLLVIIGSFIHKKLINKKIA